MDQGRLFGRGISFPPRIAPNGRMAWSEASDNIREGMRVVLATELGERVMLPQFGTDLRERLFEPNTVATRRLIQERIASALKRWEPRVAIESIVVEQDPDDETSAIATVEYRQRANQAFERLSVRLRPGR
jgi:phage baseplate assembly protein W